MEHDSQEKQELCQRQEGNLYRVLYAGKAVFSFKSEKQAIGGTVTSLSAIIYPLGGKTHDPWIAFFFFLEWSSNKELHFCIIKMSFELDFQFFTAQ